MPATRGLKIRGTDKFIRGKPKKGKGVFPPSGTPDTEGILWDLFNLIIDPLGVQGGESVHPKGAPQSGTVDPRARPAPAPDQGQTAEMMAQPTQTVQAEPFNPAMAFGASFEGSPWQASIQPATPPVPVRAPGAPAPPMPEMGGFTTPSIPDPNAAFHSAPADQTLRSFLMNSIPLPQKNPALHGQEESDRLARFFMEMAQAGG